MGGMQPLETHHDVFKVHLKVGKSVDAWVAYIRRFRWLTVLLVIGASVAGGIGAVNLTEPPTSEPPLFHEDHNVQFFWRCAFFYFQP